MIGQYKKTEKRLEFMSFYGIRSQNYKQIMKKKILVQARSPFVKAIDCFQIYFILICFVFNFLSTKFELI